MWDGNTIKIRYGYVLYRKKATDNELTAPCESRIDGAYERKKLKYSDLCYSCRAKGWSVWCLPVEVGCRGFVGISTIRALRQIGLTGKERTKSVNEISEVAKKFSSWLWLRRSDNRWEQNSRIFVSREDCATPTNTADIDCMMVKVPKESRPLHHWGRDMCIRERCYVLVEQKQRAKSFTQRVVKRWKKIYIFIP